MYYKDHIDFIVTKFHRSHFITVIDHVKVQQILNVS